MGTGSISSCAGLLRAIVWTLQAKSDTQAAACNIYGLTLNVDPQLTLTEGDAHLLLSAKLPPHAVSLPNPLLHPPHLEQPRVLRSAVQAGAKCTAGSDGCRGRNFRAEVVLCACCCSMSSMLRAGCRSGGGVC